MATAALVRAVVDRSTRYTSDREHLAAPADRMAALAARAAFFTVVDALKIAVPLAELVGRGALPARTPMRVVDLGAGCGALALGAIARVAAAIDLLAIDRDGDALKIAAGAIRRFAAPRAAAVAITTRVADVTTCAIPPADLVVIGHVLNELPAPARLVLVQRALAAIDDDGAVIVIEPALRETTRALHELRDAALAAGAHVFAPCTRAGAPCPALADPDDWCHEDRPVTFPPRTVKAHAAHASSRRYQVLAYLVLRRTPRPLVDVAGAWRIVSAPHAEKGKLEAFGCSDAGRVQIRLLRRHRADHNRAFERADRGDVLEIDAAPGEDRVEITAATRVVRLGAE